MCLKATNLLQHLTTSAVYTRGNWGNSISTQVKCSLNLWLMWNLLGFRIASCYVSYNYKLPQEIPHKTLTQLSYSYKNGLLFSRASYIFMFSREKTHLLSCQVLLLFASIVSEMYLFLNILLLFFNILKYNIQHALLYLIVLWRILLSINAE